MLWPGKIVSEYDQEIPHSGPPGKSIGFYRNMQLDAPPPRNLGKLLFSLTIRPPL